MIHIIGGGTFSHVRNHLALAAPAFGTTARALYSLFNETRRAEVDGRPGFVMDNPSVLHLTKMADASSDLVTNQDVEALIDKLVADPATRCIILNAALCDFNGQIAEVDTIGSETPSGKYAKRLKTNEGMQLMRLRPSDKIIGRIRETRKDIFAVGFKTTANATPDEQYLAGLDLLKKNSLNLVVANDTVTRNNMIIAPEETRYCETTDRFEVYSFLVKMIKARMENTFTRSTVKDGEFVKFQTDDRIPDNLRKVVNHLVERGAYKPFNGATAGHFAVKIDSKNCLTSRRKTNYTVDGGLDLVQVEYEGTDKVFAYGGKPSVGGQSQRIIFDTYDDAECIVHAHVPLKAHARDLIPVASQWQNECGSHQCGANTATNLQSFDGIRAVMLDNHGPNIVFSVDMPAERVIDFIEANFDLESKTGGLVSPKPLVLDGVA